MLLKDIIWEDKSLISKIGPHEDIWHDMPKLELRYPRIKVGSNL